MRIYLRGLDLEELVRNYLTNSYSSVKELQKVEIKEAQPEKEVIKEVSSLKSYQIDFGGQTLACIGYKVYDSKGYYSNFIPSTGYRCMQCLQKVSSQPIGIPIARDENHKAVHYHMIDIFCSFRCVYTELIRRQHNTIYSSSMSYLSEIYEKVTGESIITLKPLSDRRLLKHFNGPITWKEYHSDTKYYPERPGTLVYLPAIEYLESHTS